MSKMASDLLQRPEKKRFEVESIDACGAHYRLAGYPRLHLKGLPRPMLQLTILTR